MAVILVVNTVCHDSPTGLGLSYETGADGVREAMKSTIESSKSTDIGICYGLSFLGNAESPRNLQQTEAESEEFGICETLTNFLTDCSYRNR